MPKVTKVPDTIRPYKFHGLDLDWEGQKEAITTCPWCDKEKFNVNVDTGMYRCWTEGCDANGEGKGGNATLFIRRLHEESYKQTSTNTYLELSKDRGILPETFVHWQVAKSIITGKWMIPGYNSDRALVTLYVYGDVLYPTPTLGSRIFGANLYDPNCDGVFLNEGPWDGMLCWEKFGGLRNNGSELVSTSNREQSLLSGCSVLAIPGLGSVGSPLESWLPLFEGKEVWLCFDNDHPKKNGALPGYEATQKATALLSGIAASVNYLNWGTDGYDPKRESGFDMRDLLSA